MNKKLKMLVLALALCVTLSIPSSLTAVTFVPEPVLTIPQMIQKYAVEYRVSAERMTKTIQCESTFNPNAVGDHGQSFGLSQIHLPSWRGQITKEQALDPEFAIKFLAEKLSKGQGKLWTCYRNIYGN